MQCVVLTVYRQNGRPVFGRGGHDLLSGDDQAFLVGQRDIRAPAERGKGRHQTERSDQRADDDRRIRVRRHGQATFLAVVDLDHVTHPRTQRLGLFGSGDRDELWTMPVDLSGETIDVATGRQCHDLETIGERLDHLERAAPDRSGRAKNGQLLHTIPCRNHR